MAMFEMRNESSFAVAYAEASVCLMNGVAEVGHRRLSWLNIALRNLDSVAKYAHTPEERALYEHLHAAYVGLRTEQVSV